MSINPAPNCLPSAEGCDLNAGRVWGTSLAAMHALLAWSLQSPHHFLPPAPITYSRGGEDYVQFHIFQVILVYPYQVEIFCAHLYLQDEETFQPFL